MRVGHMDKITGQTPFYTSIKSHSIAPRAKFAKLQPKTQMSSFKKWRKTWWISSKS